MHIRYNRPPQYSPVFFACALLLTALSSPSTYAHETLNIHQASSDTSTVYIDTLTIRPDTTFEVTIYTSDLTNQGVSSFDITLSYDASLLSATSATLDGTISGPDSANLTLISNLDTAGEVSLAAAGASDLSGSGALAVITFESLSQEGSSSISFNKLVFNEGSPVVTGTSGTVHIEALMIGDPSLNNEVSAFDASLVLQHSVGVSSLSGEAFEAGETSGNGSISAYDAALVLRHVLGLINCFPVEPNCVLSKQETIAQASLSWGQTVRQNDITLLPLLVNQPEGPVHSLTIDIDTPSFDISDISTTLPSDWTVLHQPQPAGAHRIVLAGASPLQADTLLTIHAGEVAGSIQATYQINENAAETISSEKRDGTPSSFALQQNYPNPFNPSTTIQYSLPLDAKVQLVVYDMLGREVTRLVNGTQPAGTHSVQFHAEHLASGLYIFSLHTGTSSISRKMLLIK